MAVALQIMRFPFISQLNVKNVFQAANQLGTANRKKDFHAMTQVASHEVCTAEINLLSPSVPEVVDATMLQEPPDDAYNADIVTESADQRPQATKPAHEQVNLYARLRCPIEQLDHLWIFQRIH